MAKLEFPQLHAANSYQGEAGIAAPTVCERDDVKVASILSNVAHTLVSNYHI